MSIPRKLAGLSATAQRDRSASVRPFVARDWLLFNLKVGTLCFGTGSVAPLYESALVEQAHLLTRDQFQEALTVAQILPGANLVSLNMYLGSRLFGLAGGVLGVLALCIPGAVLSISMSCFVPIHRSDVQAALAGFALGAGAMIVDLLLRLRFGLAASHEPGRPLASSKHRQRIALALAVALASFAGLPLTSIVLVGAASGVAVEFIS